MADSRKLSRLTKSTQALRRRHRRQKAPFPKAERPSSSRPTRLADGLGWKGIPARCGAGRSGDRASRICAFAPATSGVRVDVGDGLPTAPIRCGRSSGRARRLGQETGRNSCRHGAKTGRNPLVALVPPLAARRVRPRLGCTGDIIRVTGGRNAPSNSHAVSQVLCRSTHPSARRGRIST